MPNMISDVVKRGNEGSKHLSLKTQVGSMLREANYLVAITELTRCDIFAVKKISLLSRNIKAIIVGVEIEMSHRHILNNIHRNNIVNQFDLTLIIVPTYKIKKVIKRKLENHLPKQEREKVEVKASFELTIEYLKQLPNKIYFNSNKH